MLARRGLRTLPHARSLATWLVLMRPHALLFAVAPVVIGLLAIFAQGRHVSWLLGLAAVLAVGLAQAGVGALDAYSEHQRYIQAAAQGENPQRGPSSVIARGVYPLEALRVGCVLLALGAIAGIPLVAHGGPLVFALALLGAALAVAYTIAPVALKRYPIGEAVLFLVLGPGILCVTILSQRQPLTFQALLLGVALGALVLASVLAGHLRDSARLQFVGRRTVAAFLPGRWLRLACVTCLALAYLLILAISLPLGGPHLALLAFLSLPAIVVPASGVLRATTGEPQALIVRQLARAYGRFSLWLALGLFLTALWVRIP
jgi:1,4-dihydroxy-2-naphthoate octaprenyltransferase